MAATIFRYDNAGRTIGILPYDSATHTEALDGTDKLVVVSEDSPTKRDRLVWQDESGLWHEHMVDATRRTHGAGGARTESTCSNSVNELYGVIVNWTKIRTRIEDVIATILSGTTWYIGDCSNFGIVEMELYHKSARECLAELCELVHGELNTYFMVGDSGVVRRYLSIVRERGRKSVMRQFQYSRNISSIVREVTSDEVYTAVKGYGAKLFEYDTNEYPTRLEAVVNSNMDLTRWGVPMGDGTFAHNYTTYTDAQCTDRTFLTKQCKSVLDSVSKPLVRYEFDTVDAGDGLWSDVRLGDKVMCIDEQFNPPLELIERVSEIRRNLKGRMQCRIVIGARANPLVDKFKASEKVNKKSTGNQSRITAASPVSTLGAGFDGEGAAGIGDVPMPTVIEPSSIAVTTPPNKTEYYEGERIDYTGMVVTLYNSDSSVYTDEWHADGIAAFEELTLPIELASATDEKKYATTTIGQFPNRENVTINSVATSLAYVKWNLPSWSNWHGYFVRATSGDDIRAIFIRNGESQFALMLTSLNPFGVESGIVDKDDKYQVTSTVQSGKVTIQGKECYYYGLQGNFPYAFQSSNIAQSDVNLSWMTDRSAIAWCVWYGDTEEIGSGSHIPVQWTRQDGQILETSFDITVMPPKFYSGPTWGGGEGIDTPASSGGGKF